LLFVATFVSFKNIIDQLFVYSHTRNFSAIWWLSSLPVTGLQIYAYARRSEQGGIFIVLHQLRHGTSVYTVSSERLAPTSQSGIRPPDNHYAMRVTVKDKLKRTIFFLSLFICTVFTVVPVLYSSLSP
jgi:hypothetical protein